MRLIDADALLDKMQDYGEGQERLMLIDPYWVRKAPTIDRPNGEWIKFTLEGGFLSSHKCSNCGFSGNQLWHYCPNCGASMQANDRQVTGKLDDNTTLLYSITNGDNFIGKEGEKNDKVD